MAPAVKPLVFLPIEYRSREFDGKLALAAKLIQSGVAVVIGQQWAMYNNFKRLPAGIVLFKSQNKIHHEAMVRARAAGHVVVSLEEESLALTSGESIVRNCPPETYGLVDFLLTTGDIEKQTHLKEGCDPSKLVITGNPRIDVLKPAFRPLFQDAIDRLHERFGRFVLINTNFGIRNTKWGSVEAVRRIEINAGSLNPADPESVQRFDHMLEWEEKNSQALFATVERLAKSFPDRTFIVRPHPSESLQKVAGEYVHLPNVKVIHEGAHIPWTMGCDLLLHTSCTTGLEAAIAGKQATSLVTLESWASRAFLSNQVNPVFSSVDAIVENSQRILTGGAGVTPPPLSSFEHYIRNISETSSIDLISQFLKGLARESGELKFAGIAMPERNQVLVEKCSISPEEMKTTLAKLGVIFGFPGSEAPLYQMGDSIFLLAPLPIGIKQ